MLLCVRFESRDSDLDAMSSTREIGVEEEAFMASNARAQIGDQTSGSRDVGRRKKKQARKVASPPRFVLASLAIFFCSPSSSLFRSSSFLSLSLFFLPLSSLLTSIHQSSGRGPAPDVQRARRLPGHHRLGVRDGVAARAVLRPGKMV